MVSTEPTYNLRAASNITLEARFTPNQYDFKITAGAGGTVSGGGTHNYGTSVTLRATPNKGFSFGGWFDGNSLVSTEKNYTLTVTQHRTLQARFSVTLGDVERIGEPTIGGVLEILKYLAGMKSILNSNTDSFKSACITGTEPNIGDVLEILKYLAGMNSLLKQH
jgi:hypothetical protein